MNKPSEHVFIVDDDAAMRDSLAMLLEQKGFEVETFAGGEAFLAAWRPEWRGCVIIDQRMPGMDGLTLQEVMQRRGIMLPVIFLTGHGDIPSSVKAIKDGAVDYLTKPVTAMALLDSVHSALHKMDAMQRQSEDVRRAESCLDCLTPREREVLTLLVTGKSNKEIARSMGISHRTVEIHKAHVMHKTGAASVLDLVRLAETGYR